METIRNSTFETNSSSCHCMVVAGETDYQKFVNGELFADCGSYKSPIQAKLITLDEVVALYNKHVEEEQAWATEHNYDCSYKPVSAALAKWVLLHPEFIDLDDCVKRTDYLKEHRDGLPDEDYYDATETFCDNASDVGNWLNMDYTPFSYKMLAYCTKDFTTEYDDYSIVYKSYQGKDVEMKDGSKVKELNAVWYD